MKQQNLVTAGSAVSNGGTIGADYQGVHTIQLGSTVDSGMITTGTSVILSPVNGNYNLMSIIGTGGVLSR